MKVYLKEIREMIEIGRKAVTLGLTDSHGGNISVRRGEHLIIKRSGKTLGWLKEEDFVITTLEENESLDKEASVELKVHRAIYQNFPKVKGILHTHSPYTVACSLTFDSIVPLDSEGKLLLSEVPVLSASKVVSSEEVAEKIVKLLKNSPVVVVKSHGPFAVGSNLEEALKFISALENSCKILATYYSLTRGKS